MERIEDHSSMSASLPRVRLYREQLEDIIDALKDAELEVRISDGEFTFNDLDDLKENRGTQITHVAITGHIPIGYKFSRF